MIIYEPHDLLPICSSITIGFFDGVHLGHLKIFKALKKKSLVITFTNHPSEILSPEDLPNLITTLEERLNLFEKANIDYVLILPFTKQLMNTSYQDFLFPIFEQTQFELLLLGKGSTFGKKQLGSEKTIQELAKQWRFEAKYIEPVQVFEETISSSKIRMLIQQGEIEKAEHYLGRSFEKSIF